MMKPTPIPTTALGDDDADAVNAALALALALAPVPAVAAQAVRERLLARTRRSAEAHRDFVTVRHGDTPWSGWQAGVRTRALHGKGALRMRLIELQAGAALPPPGDAQAQEIVVLAGALAGALVGAHALPAHSFLLRAGGDTLAWTAPQGALLYVRELHGARSELPDAEARWWPAAGAAPVVLPASDEGWQPFAPGVQVKPLAGNDEAISMLARIAAGARVNVHGHRLDEDCVMLEGDLYLGDVLLREHEYQLAPAGTTHNGLLSDDGAVLYFHGAIDPALRDAG
jgi:hypothetical protein